MMTIALAGNQNSGKTTLFNRLTGTNQHVGNWPGVTIEKKIGMLSSNENVQVVDLPGIYSLSPYTPEEVVSRDYITVEKPDVVINVVDAGRLERSLYLTVQLLQLGVPVVIALNMMDEVQASGDVIHLDVLQRELHVPVMPISAKKGTGISALVEAAVACGQQGIAPRFDLSNPYLGKIAQLIRGEAARAGLTAEYAAAKLAEGDLLIEDRLYLPDQERMLVRQLITDMEAAAEMESMEVLADMRYAFIKRILSKAVVRAPRKDGIGDRLDRVLLHPLLAIPAFASIMLAMFWITFGPFGSWLNGIFSAGIGHAISWMAAWLDALGASLWLREMITEGILRGIGSVLSFLPTILLLFLCMSMLEDSGYMARAAFLMDKPLRGLGLSGRSVIPLLLGFGCTVPAVMATRAMTEKRDKRLTILLTPMMSCGAKAPVYVLLVNSFFPENAFLIMTCLYLGGIFMAVIAARFLRGTSLGGAEEPFVMEIPAYRLPSFRSVMMNVADRVKDFVQRAFTVILLATVIIWLLQTRNLAFQQAESTEQSILGIIAGRIAPLFTPLGFGNAAAVMALLSGLMAKESIVSTLSLMTVGELHSIFPGTGAAAAFLTFVLLYAPCVAALAAIRRELGSWKWAALSAIGQTGLAWGCAWIIGRLLSG